MRQPEENLFGVAHRSTDRYRVRRDRYGDARSMRAPLVAEVVGRKVDSCVLAMSGELSRRSVASATGIVSKALNDERRVVVDLSGLRTTARPAAEVFPSALTAVGGWPAARLVLFGADPELATSLTVLREMDTVPLAADEPIARQLLQHRPPAVARHLDVDDEPFAARRARQFVTAACQDWQLDATVCDDAVLVASELVGNAIAHAGTACRLNVRLDALGLTIAVRDYDYRGLLNPLACTSAGRRGQGLFLVASVSQAWGAGPTENGKRVWALLPATTAAR
jgi:anti-sigma regulatory factor (Ser/Thr protein kinase)